MKVNTDSWHYKYISSVTNVFEMLPAKNLCQYIRRFVGATIFYTLCLAILELVGMCAYFSLFSSNFMVAALLGVPFGLGAFAIAFIIGFGGAWLVMDKIPSWIKSARNKNKTKTKEEAQPSPFVQYVKDKHNKMCSTIEYE